MATVQFSAWPIVDRSVMGGNEYHSTMPFQAHSKQTVEVENLADAERKFDAYKALRIKDGKPVECHIYWPRQTAKKFRGWDKATARGGKLEPTCVNKEMIPLDVRS